LRFGDGGEMTAAVVLGPGGDGEVAFGQFAWRLWEGDLFPAEDCDGRGDRCWLARQ